MTVKKIENDSPSSFFYIVTYNESSLDGTQNDGKLSRSVRSRGKARDNFKRLPITNLVKQDHLDGLFFMFKTSIRYLRSGRKQFKKNGNS